MSAESRSLSEDVDILHIVPFFNSNFSYLENHLPVSQAKLGQKVVLLAGKANFPFHPLNTYTEPSAEHFEFGSGELRLLPCFSWFWKRHPGINWCNVVPYLKLKPATVYVHGVTSLNIFYGLYFALTSNAKVVLDCHNDLSNENKDIGKGLTSYFLALHALLLRALLKLGLIKKIISIGLGSTVYCEARLGLSRKYISEINLGYDGDLFFPDVNRSKKQRLSKENGKLKIGVIGKFSREKNLSVAGELIDLLQNKGIACSIFFAGPFVDFATEQEAALVAKQANEAEFLGMLNSLERKAFFQNMDLCLWPGRPSVLIQECIASGCCAIVSDHQSTYKFVFGNVVFSEEKNNEKFFQQLEAEPCLFNLFAAVEKHQRRALIGCSWDEIAHELQQELN
jgi:glycosyltransferase involved in cell wall biosynthesis